MAERLIEDSAANTSIQIDLPLESLEIIFDKLNDGFLNPITSAETNISDQSGQLIAEERKLPITIRESSVMYQVSLKIWDTLQDDKYNSDNSVF